MSEEVKHVSPEQNYWGNRISIREMDYQDQTAEIDGHKMPKVSEGDRFAHKLENGNYAIFEFTDVEYKADPNDMFFADADAVGVVETRKELEVEKR